MLCPRVSAVPYIVVGRASDVHTGIIDTSSDTLTVERSRGLPTPGSQFELGYAPSWTLEPNSRGPIDPSHGSQPTASCDPNPGLPSRFRCLAQIFVAQTGCSSPI